MSDKFAKYEAQCALSLKLDGLTLHAVYVNFAPLINNLKHKIVGLMWLHDKKKKTETIYADQSSKDKIASLGDASSSWKKIRLKYTVKLVDTIKSTRAICCIQWFSSLLVAHTQKVYMWSFSHHVGRLKCDSRLVMYICIKLTY